jgi:HlyD family secretion protein
MPMDKKLLAAAITLIVMVSCSSKISDRIVSAGVVDGDVVTVKAAVSGKVETLSIAEGASVSQDDLLAAIDTDKIENQLQGLSIQEKEVAVDRKKLDRRIRLLETNLTYWKKQVERFERLQEKESISGDRLEQARLKLEEVEASLFDARQSLHALSILQENIQNKKEQLSLILEDYYIVSPVTGIVLEKFVSQGEMLFPGTPVADILDLSSLFVETFLEEMELSRLRIGQIVEIRVDGMEERNFSGHVIYFGQKAEFSPKYIISEKERRSLLYRVKVKIDRDLEMFKLGMPVTVSFGTS